MNFRRDSAAPSNPPPPAAPLAAIEPAQPVLPNSQATLHLDKSALGELVRRALKTQVGSSGLKLFYVTFAALSRWVDSAGRHGRFQRSLASIAGELESSVSRVRARLHELEARNLVSRRATGRASVFTVTTVPALIAAADDDLPATLPLFPPQPASGRQTEQQPTPATGPTAKQRSGLASMVAELEADALADVCGLRFASQDEYSRHFAGLPRSEISVLFGDLRHAVDRQRARQTAANRQIAQGKGPRL